MYKRQSLPGEIRSRTIIISHIGRVYNILIDMEEKDLKKLLDSPEIVQYDRLDMKVEDYFYLEEGAK